MVKNKEAIALAEKTQVSESKRKGRKLAAFMSSVMMTASLMTMQASADGWDTVTVGGQNADAAQLMGKIIGILLTITRYVGVALVIYGVYEIVMSFMQNQPEAKTKGIIMALAGAVMITLKTILSSLGIVS